MLTLPGSQPFLTHLSPYNAAEISLPQCRGCVLIEKDLTREFLLKYWCGYSQTAQAISMSATLKKAYQDYKMISLCCQVFKMVCLLLQDYKIISRCCQVFKIV